jgi:hypothetical protein
MISIVSTEAVVLAEVKNDCCVGSVTCFATEDAKCDVLGTGDAVRIITSFIYDSTSQYNFFLQCVMTL